MLFQLKKIYKFFSSSKNEHELLQLMQNRYTSMFNKHDSVMLLINAKDGTIIDANESAENFYGYTHEEFLSLNISDINQLSREELALIMPQTIQREKSHFIFQHKLKNGKIRIVEVFGSPIETENGKLIFSIIRDITKEKENEERFKELSLKTEIDRQRYEAFMKFSSDNILIMDMEGNLKECSQMAATMLGYTMQEMTKLNVYDLDAIFQADDLLTFMRATPTQEPIYFETKHRRKDGSTYDAAIKAIQLIIDGEAVIYSSIRDITEQKELLNQIKKEALRKELALSTGTVGIWEWNMETDTLIWDSVMYQIYGVEETDRENPYTTWNNAVDSNDKPAVEENLFFAKENHTEYNISFWITTPAGERKYIHAIAKFEFDTLGKAYKMIGLNIDTTELKNKEMDLKNILDQQEALYKVQTTGFVYLKDRHFQWTNETFETMLGYEKGELQGKPTEIIYQDDEEYKSYGRDAYVSLKTIGNFTREIKGIKKDGTKITILTSMTSLKEDSSEAIGIAFDITEMTKQAELIKKQNEEFKTIFEISRDGIAILDLKSNFLDFNDAYLAMTGFSREELLANSCVGLSILEDQERSIQAIEIVIEVGYLESFEKTCIVKNGKFIVIKMAMSLMPDKKRIMISTKDITDIRHHEEELKFIAHYDPLTKLPNRVLLYDRMKQSIANAHRNNGKLAIAYLDLDGFKQINDTHGHDAGDILLIEISKRMQNSLREGDTLARLGGDEFVAILGNQNDKSETFSVLNRLLDAAASTVNIQNTIVTVSASIGVTFYSHEQGVDADILLRQADQAMYEAKLRGKNQIAVFEDIADLSNQVSENALAIKNALNNNEFVLFYQPKVNMKSSEVIGAEALIRWNDPQRGMIYPDDFLSIVDNRPLMLEIDKWVLNEALSQLCTWHNEGLDTKVSINISAYTFKQPHFISLIDEVIAKYPSIEPCQIDIEILESSSLHEIEEVRQIIEKLHERNITVSLDDFGTGYSTLSYLKKLGIDTLKIDKSFVLDILHDTGDLSIIEASVGLAEAFNAKPLAEGVESVEHGNALLQLGCQLAQGYIIARPMRADLFPNWIKEWKSPQSWQDIQRNS